MEVEFLEKFSRDLDNLNNVSTKIAIRKIITAIETTETLREIPNIKKLKGFRSAYRIRIGDYRLGIFAEGNIVQFARIVHRREIYKVFP